MKTASNKVLNEELHSRNPGELLEICLRFAKFKKENKELLTYLLFESGDETAYIAGVKNDINTQFVQVNRKSKYFLKKSIRKILLNTKKYIHYSQNKLTEIELLICFCRKLKNIYPPIKNYNALLNLYIKQVDDIKKKVSCLHEDLQLDYAEDLKELTF